MMGSYSYEEILATHIISEKREARQEGEKVGEKREARQAAEEMLRDGIPIEKIAKYVHALSLEELKAIEADVKQQQPA